MILTNKNIIIVLIPISNAMACKINNFGRFFFFEDFVIIETKLKEIHIWSKNRARNLGTGT